jgi:spore coat protein U-like protein
MRTNHHLKTTAFINKREKSMKTKFNQRKIKLAIASAIIAAGAAGLSATSYADDVTMDVTASVSMSCTFSAGALAFGTYDPTAGGDTTGTADITSTCTSGGSAYITLDQGDQPTGLSTDSIPIRQMIGSGGNLGYYLYTNGEETAVWGNTSLTGKTVIGTGSPATTTVHGTIPALQAVGAGSFADSVVVTFTY